MDVVGLPPVREILMKKYPVCERIFELAGEESGKKWEKYPAKGGL